MDAASETQALIVIIFVTLLAFCIVVLYLLTNLIINRRRLNLTQKQLKDLNLGLEAQVQQRTEELSLSEALFKSLFEQSKEAVFLVEQDTFIIKACNARSEIIIGHSKEELIGRRFDDFFGKYLREVKTEGDYDYIYKTASGEIKMLEATIGSVNYKGKSCYQVICRDVTEKRSLEAQKIQNDKMISLGLMAAGVAHELKNPLGTITNSASFLKGEFTDPSPKAIKHLEFIESEVSLCKSVINNLAAMSKGTASKTLIESIKINTVLDRIVSLLERSLLENKIELVKAYSEIPEVKTSNTQVTQVINNIITNSVEAMPSGGRLIVGSSFLAAYLFHNAIKECNAVEIFIEDSGVGMDEAELTNIFIPFYTHKTESGGTGLGLWITYNLVKKLGGEIKVESQKGKGTKVSIILPVEQ